MPVPNTIADLNQAAASNYPLGTDTVGPNLDDYIRAISAFVRQLFDGTPWLLGTVAGTADAITAISSVPFTAYVAGQEYKFLPVANNTSTTVTINVNGIGAKNITKNGSQPLAPNDLVAGVAAVLLYDGTQMQLLSTPGTLNGNGTYSVRGLVGANNATTPNTKYDFSADAVTLRGVGNRPSFTGYGSGVVTNDIAAVQSGPQANGRDQIATFSASNWIHFYFIWNGSALATLSSLVPPATGPTMPTGYTHWAYIGAVFYNSTPVLVRTRIKGAVVSYDTSVQVLNNGAATSQASVILSSAIPPNALAHSVTAILVGTSSGTGFCATTAVLGVVSGLTSYQFQYAGFNNSVSSSLGLGATWHVSMIPNNGQIMYYYMSNGTGSGALYLNVTDYKVPNGGE